MIGSLATVKENRGSERFPARITSRIVTVDHLQIGAIYNGAERRSRSPWRIGARPDSAPVARALYYVARVARPAPRGFADAGSHSTVESATAAILDAIDRCDLCGFAIVTEADQGGTIGRDRACASCVDVDRFEE